MRWDAKLLAVLSGLVLLLLAACNLSTQPDPASQALAGVPAVQIVAPLPNATYLEGVTVNIQAQIQNAGPDVARVDFAVDNQVFASLTDPNSTGASVLSVSESWVSSGTGAHSLSVSAVRGDGSFSVPVNVTVTVVGQVSQPSQGDSGTTSGGGAGSGDAGQQPREQPQEPERTAPEPEPTSDRPMARFLRGANVRSGPDTRFAPPIGSIAAGDQAELLAINIHKTWYKIKYYNGEGWVFGSLLEVSGNVDDLPVVYGPPLPAPTAIPVTAVPPTAVLNVNLVAGNMRHNAGRNNYLRHWLQGGSGRGQCRLNALAGRKRALPGLRHQAGWRPAGTANRGGSDRHLPADRAGPDGGRQRVHHGQRSSW